MFVIKAKVAIGTGSVKGRVGNMRYDYYYVPGAAFETYTEALSVFLGNYDDMLAPDRGFTNSKLLLSMVSTDSKECMLASTGLSEKDLSENTKSDDYTVYNPRPKTNDKDGGYIYDKYTIRNFSVDSFFIEKLKDNREDVYRRVIRSGGLLKLMSTRRRRYLLSASEMLQELSK